MNYYNENDKKAAAWLRELIKEGLIPEGTVDERSITEVKPEDLVGYIQCHFFAGIGGWPVALQLAGWPIDREVWTGSCPCQPFSNAGKRKGKDDERHLWPELYKLIDAHRPTALFGEQVGSKLGREWNVGVYADLEEIDYIVPKDENGNYELYDLPACSVGEKDHPLIKEARRWAYAMADMLDLDGDSITADELRDFANYLGGVIVGPPHIRQRLWWMAIANGAGWEPRRTTAEGARHRYSIVANGSVSRLANGSSNRWAQHGEGSGERQEKSPPDTSERNGSTGGMGHTELQRTREGREGREGTQGIGRDRLTEHGIAGGLVQSFQSRLEGLGGHGDDRDESRRLAADSDGSIATPSTTGFWSDFYIQPCRDGKVRRVKSGLHCLAHGVQGRVGLLRGYGNAINPYVGAEVVKAFMQVTGT